MARDFGYKTEGIEIETAAAKKSKTKGHRIFIGDITKIKLSNNYADVIVMFHTLEHLKVLSFAVSKIKSILKKDGIIVVEVPNLWHWLLQRRLFMKRVWHLSGICIISPLKHQNTCLKNWASKFLKWDQLTGMIKKCY